MAKKKKTKKVIKKKSSQKKAVKKVVAQSTKTLKKAKRVATKAGKKIKKVVTKASRKIAKRVAAKAIRVVARAAKKVGKGKEKPIGMVTHWFNNISVAIVKLKAPLTVGDKIRIRHGNGDSVETVSSMQVNHAPITKAGAGKEVGIKVKDKTHEGADVYKV